jgi:hypothetical protein
MNGECRASWVEEVTTSCPGRRKRIRYFFFSLPSRECDELVSQQTYLRYLEGMVSIVHSILVLTKKRRCFLDAR